jgi:hypothetical protein
LKVDFQLTPMNGEDKHWRDIDALENNKFHRVNGSHTEGCWLLVSMMQFVEILV